MKSTVLSSLEAPIHLTFTLSPIFTFAVSSESAKILNSFAKVVEENPYIQFGGNASIGYGLCNVEEIGRNYPKCDEVKV